MATATDRVEFFVHSLNEQLNRLLANSTSSTTGLALSTLVIGSVTYVVYSRLIYQLFFHPVARIPGPSVSLVPFAGNFLEILRNEAGKSQLKWVQTYGGIVRYYGLFNVPRILITDPALVREVLVTRSYEFIKSPLFTRTLGQFLGVGILLAEGDDHKHQRKLLNPAFSHANIKSLVPIFFGPARELRNMWNIDLIGEEKADVDVFGGLTAATLDIIGKAGFGYDFDATNADEEEDVNALSKAYSQIFAPVGNITRILSLIIPGWSYLPLPSNIRTRRAIRTIRDTTKEIVDSAKNKAIEEKEVEEDRKTRDILSILVEERDENGKEMEESLLRAQVMTFLAAGHETTSVATTWALHLLSENLEVQARLREEVTPLFGKITTEYDVNKLPTYDEIDSLKYLNAVAKETLRLIPPVPMTSRFSTVDVTLGGHFVPKGTQIFVAPVVTQRLPQIWGEDSFEFNPDRWFSEPAASISPYLYIPFLAGPRSCIGNKFAIMELKVLLGLLVSAFIFKPKPGWVVTKKQSITWRPSPGMRLIIERADKGIPIADLMRLGDD